MLSIEATACWLFLESYLDECDSSGLLRHTAHHLVAKPTDELVRDHEHQQIGPLGGISQLGNSHLAQTKEPTVVHFIHDLESRVCNW